MLVKQCCCPVQFIQQPVSLRLPLHFFSAQPNNVLHKIKFLVSLRCPIATVSIAVLEMSSCHKTFSNAVVPNIQSPESFNRNCCLILFNCCQQKKLNFFSDPKPFSHLDPSPSVRITFFSVRFDVSTAESLVATLRETSLWRYVFIRDEHVSPRIRLCSFQFVMRRRGRKCLSTRIQTHTQGAH